jgi:hypothetical protein
MNWSELCDDWSSIPTASRRFRPRVITLRRFVAGFQRSFNTFDERIVDFDRESFTLHQWIVAFDRSLVAFRQFIPISTMHRRSRSIAGTLPSIPGHWGCSEFVFDKNGTGSRGGR